MDKSDSKQQEPLKKKRKVGRGNESVPTREELTNLRENVTLFASSLYRLQIEELLNAVRIDDKKKIKIEKWFEEFKTEAGKYSNTNDSEPFKLSKLVLPTVNNSQHSIKKESFTFHPPEEINLIGSFPLNLGIKSTNTIDISILIPKKCLHKDDNINLRYHFKRALYLLHFARHLQKSELVDNVEFEYFHGDELKPILVATPKGSLGKKFTVKIIPRAPMDFFKSSKLTPGRNNIRSKWFLDEEIEFDEEKSTPIYNNSILSDVLVQEHQNYLSKMLTDNLGIRDGILLLKVWLHQRELDEGFGAVNNFIITMFVAHLLVIKKLHPLMSSFQVARTTWLILSQSDWTKNLNTLQTNFEDFFAYFPVVLLNPSGNLNLCLNVEESTFLRLKHEAQLAVNLIDNGNNFDALFMTSVPFRRKFDHFIQIEADFDDLYPVIDKFELKDKLVDRIGNVKSTILPILIKILRKGLGNRIDLIDVQLRHQPTWKIDEKPSTNENKVQIGLLLNQQHNSSILDKGPSADSVDAKEFRDFWGEKSELRRFQDTSICEAVTWKCSSLSERRLVSSQVVTYLLKRHFNIDQTDINYIGGQLDNLLTLNFTSWPDDWPVYGTGEEILAKCVNVLDQLRTQLQRLDDLPLAITSVQGISPSFRYTEVFPPLPDGRFKKGDLSNKIGKNSVPNTNYVHQLDVLISMEGSNKWPNDVEAVKRIKAAFYLKLASLVKDQCHLTCAVNQEYVCILKDGFVFRIQIAYKREATLLKMERSDDGILKLRENEKSTQLERDIIHLPKLTSILHGLQLQHGSFSSACRLAKRWISSQLLSDFVSDLGVELIMTKVFISPQPFTPPRSALVAFQRWLWIIANHLWKTAPLVVNLNNELSEEAITELTSKFTANRDKLPPLFIATPFDTTSSSWTKNAPNMTIFNRLVELSRGALNILEKQLENQKSVDFKIIFRPSLSPYDVIINLKENEIPIRHCFIDEKMSLQFTENKSDSRSLPVLDFDPVRCFIDELRNCFDDFAAFFYDKYGGGTIGVLWKMQQFQPTPFKVTRVNSCKLNEEGKLVPNLEAMIEDFAILGEGLVKTIQANLDTWKIK